MSALTKLWIHASVLGKNIKAETCRSSFWMNHDITRGGHHASLTSHMIKIPFSPHTHRQTHWTINSSGSRSGFKTPLSAGCKFLPASVTVNQLIQHTFNSCQSALISAKTATLWHCCLDTNLHKWTQSCWFSVVVFIRRPQSLRVSRYSRPKDFLEVKDFLDVIDMLFPRSIAGLAVFFRHFAQGWGEEKKKRERDRGKEAAGGSPVVSPNPGKKRKEK